MLTPNTYNSQNSVITLNHFSEASQGSKVVATFIESKRKSSVLDAPSLPKKLCQRLSRIIQFPAEGGMPAWSVKFKQKTPLLPDFETYLEMDEVEVISKDETESDGNTILTLGVGPCIAIIGMGFTDKGVTGWGMLHWSGPRENEDVQKAARRAVKKIAEHFDCINLERHTIKYFLFGSEKESYSNMKVLEKILRIPKEHIFIPPQAQYGWDVAVTDGKIYFGSS